MSQTHSPTTTDLVSQNPWATAAESALTVAWYAMPDFVRRRKQRAAVKTALFLGAGAYGVYVARQSENDDADSGPGDELPEAPPSDGEVLVTGAVIVAAGAALVGGAALFERLVQRAGGRLSERGVKYPHTVVGLALGALQAVAQPVIHTVTSRRTNA